MNVAFFKPGEIPESLRRFWIDACLAHDPVSRFTGGPEWFEMMAGKTAGAAVAALREDSGEWRAVLPLLPRRWALETAFLGRRYASKNLDILKVCGGDLIVRAAVAPHALTAMWSAVFDRFPNARAIGFDHVTGVERSALIGASVKQAGRGSLFAHHLVSRLPHYRLRLPETRAACERLRSRKSLKRLWEKERALARRAGGDVRVVELRSEADWAPYAEAIEALMNRSWQARLLGHGFAMTDQREVAERGWLRAFLLLAGDRAVAFDGCYQAFGVLVYEHVGFDQTFAAFSPGAILLHRLLPRLYDADLPRVVDFGEGEAEYKRRVANDVICTDSLLVVRARGKLKLAFAWARAVQAVDGWVRSGVKRFALGRKLIQRLKRGA